MNKSFRKIIFVGFGNIFNAVLGFAFLSVVAKTLDLESFGKYALITTLLVAVSRLIDFGTNSVYVAKSISTEDKSLTDIFFTLKIILFLLSIPVSIFILNILHLGNLNLIIIFILGLLAYAINYTFNSFFQKKEKFTQLVFLNTLPAIIKGIFAYLIFFNGLKADLPYTFSVFSLSVFSSSLLIFFLPKEFKKLHINFSRAKQILKEAFPAGISLLIYEGWPSIANSIAKIAKDFSNVGIFSIAEKIANILALGSLSVFTVLLPKNSMRKKENKEYDFKEIYIISILILLAAFVGTFISKIFVSKFLGDKFSDSLPILGLLIFASAFTSIHSFMEHYFYIEEKTRLIMYINVGKLVLFLILSSILVPILSLKGLALANIIAAIFALFLTILFVSTNQKRKYKDIEISLKPQEL